MAKRARSRATDGREREFARHSTLEPPCVFSQLLITRGGAHTFGRGKVSRTGSGLGFARANETIPSEATTRERHSVHSNIGAEDRQLRLAPEIPV
jgi:hypothetical protein